ncbi:glutamate receptor 2.9-like [Ricinus communis]|uniref:glutamate receptor 2.9-like n=1 Tax=Ricinus communis TaxID=3988 RepID=UPI00201AAA5B|nr:glutamate receptor 2.9-like [Ricinus communis]
MALTQEQTCYVLNGIYNDEGILLMEMAMAQNTIIPVKVGVVLYDSDDCVGKMQLPCINMSLLDFNANHGHYKTRLVLHTRDSNGDVGAAAAGNMRRKALKPDYFCFLILLSAIWILFVSKLEMVMANNKPSQVKIGVVLDLDDDNCCGKIGLSCITMAVSDFYTIHSHYKTRLVIDIRDSNRDVVLAATAAMDLTKNVQVQAIIGPSTSMQANFVAQVGEKSQVPIISFSASRPSLTSIRNSYFFRATQNDRAQVNAISAIVQSFGWREAVPIYVDNEYGVGIISHLVNALQVAGTRVPYLSAFSPLASDEQILEELYKLKTTGTRVFIVHMFPSLGSRIFNKANEIGMTSENYSWILTDGMSNFLSSIDHSIFNSMSGRVLGVKPYIPNTKKLENFQARWKEKFNQDHQGMFNAELNIYGLWAYDATMALAMAIEKAASTATFGFETKKFSSNSLDLETFGVSQNGPILIESLANTSFKGLTGDFIFVNQQLQSSNYQIVNVNDVGLREDGLWPPKKGFVSKLSLASSLQAVASTSVSKKLRIGVPNRAFNEFMNVERDAKTNATICSGYCIDVFEAAMKDLSNPPSYEYIPFNGTFDDLVFQVYLGNFDGVVGDVTITERRSFYVDFTLPYIEHGGVSIIVPIEDHRSSRSWVFLKPLTWRLWVTSICLYVFIAAVLWVLKNRNEELQGSPSRQTGTRFSCSAIVFPHKEKVARNLASITVVIWCILGFVLTQSYGAALSSFLTVQQLQPTVNYVTELIQKREKVGYQNGSFVFGVLKGLGFHDSQLVSCSPAEQCERLLSKGSKHGGIGAAFDEMPYTNLILAQSCSKYSLVQPILDIQQFKTNGFGFVFPKGSSFAVEVSRAILKLKESYQMKKMEDKWFGKQKHCSLHASDVSVSTKLDLDSFQELFWIAGVASSLALVIYTGLFVHEHRQVLTPPYSSASILSIVQDLLRIINRKDSNFNSAEHVYPNISDRPRQDQMAPNIELTDRDQERPPNFEIAHENN